MNTMQLSDLRNAATYGGIALVSIYRGYNTGFKWEITALLEPTALTDERLHVHLATARGNLRLFSSLDAAYRAVREIGVERCHVYETPASDNDEEQFEMSGV